MKMRVCKRDNLCYKCDDDKCLHHGSKVADCPKYKCDRKLHLREKCYSCYFWRKYIRVQEDEENVAKA